MNLIKSLFLILISLSVFSQQKKEQAQKYLRFNNQVNSSEIALNQFSELFKLGKENTFQLKATTEDKTGMKHEKFQQFYKNIKVEFGTAILHSKNNYVVFANGELYNPNGINLVPSFGAEEAFSKALETINASVYLWQDEDQAKIMNYEKPKGELVIFPDVNNESIHLAYKFDIFALSPISRQEVYIDAHSGEYLFANAIIKHANEYIEPKIAEKRKRTFETIVLETGNADTRYSGSQEIETTFNGSSYILYDQSRGLGIRTFNCENTTTYQNVDFEDNDNNWSAAEYDNVAKDNGALDAQWGAATTFDFFQNIFNRNSYDDNGATINSYVHFGNNYNNASWNGSAMTYGDGSSFDILTSIDVCGHEIGHAVCTYTAGLIYRNESGALNEGFSDIWGACVEHYGRTGGLTAPRASAVWLIGEDLATNPLRSMSNPNLRGDPDTYLGTNWYSGTADSGGVHTNSGVLNHWFYILTEGKSGTNSAPIPDTYNVTGIGLVKSSEIAYLAERDYLTPNSTFMDARNATIEVVNALYCANSPEAIAVTNAWFAVNVGEEYTAVNDDVALQSIQETSLISCSATTLTSNLIIKNQGLNPIRSIDIEFSIDGGSITNESWSGRLLPCNEVTYPLTVSGLTRGAHTLEVTTTIVNDGRPENNTKSIVLLINDEGTIGVSNGFTNPSDELISYNESDANPTWVRGERIGTLTSNGNIVYTTNLLGNYEDKKKAYLVSQCYNLTNVTNPEISFDMKFDLEQDWDVVYVEYSTDFGANWSLLGNMTAGWYNSNRTSATSGSDCFNCPGGQWTGTNTNLNTYSYSLNELVGSLNVIFRIVFHSDQAVNNLGVTIDDFVVQGVLDSDSFLLSNAIKVYPNPSNGNYTIYLNDLQPNSIEVFDVSGKKIITKKYPTVTDSMFNLNLTDFSTGIYFVKINSDGQNIVKRVVKQ